MYTITKECLQSLYSYMERCRPYEGCGIIAAEANFPTALTHFYPIRNNHPNPKHFFQFHAEDWIKVNYELLKSQQRIVCYLHSHIDGDVYLSADDLNGITDFQVLQAIVKLTKKDSPSIYVYQFKHDTHSFESCPLTLT